MRPLAAPRTLRLALPVGALLLALAGCATTEEGVDGGGGADLPQGSGFRLAPTAEDVKTVLLHPAGDEAALPVLALGSPQTLRLSFDVLGGRGDAYEVRFYHADRDWRRDLSPAEFLDGFQTDLVRDYTFSSGTEVRYVHYAYQFPNAAIRFRVSGNYVLRVNRPGDEADVLFERPFFISENLAEINFVLGSGVRPSGAFLQPAAQIGLPAGLNQPIFDYGVCFAQNGRVERVRCAPEPDLLGQALYQFHLPRELSFAADEGYFDLDLGVLQAGLEVARVDFTTAPYTVYLNPDYGRFGGDAFTEVAGQPLVERAVRDVADPSFRAQYATVVFEWVPPDEQPADGDVILSGSFNGWAIDPAYRLTWDPETARYRGAFLLKQGRYLYRYLVESPRPTRGPAGVGIGQPQLFTAFVYLYDPSLDSDRLVGTRSTFVQ